MSIKVMSWVWESVELKAAHKLVLLSLADNANDDGVCWPSITTIARKCGLNARYVQRILTDLKDAGFISIAYRREGTLNKSNVYTVHFGTIDHHPGGSRATTPDGLQTPTHGGTLTTTLVAPVPPDPSFNRKSFNHQEEPPAEAAAAADPNLLKLLDSAGIYEPTATRLAKKPWMTPQYLEAHIAEAERLGISTGLLVTRLANNDPPPLTREQQEAAERQSYVSGPLAQYIEH